MADRQFPIIEGEPTWETNAFHPLDPFHFNDSMIAAGYHVGEAGDYVPTYRGEPAIIDLYSLFGNNSNAPAATITSTPAAPIVAPVVAPVVTPTTQTTQTNQQSASNLTGMLVIGVVAVLVISILT